MNNHSLQTLPINDALKLKLGEILIKFESSRIGNDLNKSSIIVEEEKETAVVKEKKVSLIKRLFLTDYGD